MKLVEMENGQAWQQLISRSHGLNIPSPGGDSDYDTPSNQVTCVSLLDCAAEACAQ